MLLERSRLNGGMAGGPARLQALGLFRLRTASQYDHGCTLSPAEEHTGLKRQQGNRNGRANTKSHVTAR